MTFYASTTLERKCRTCSATERRASPRGQGASICAFSGLNDYVQGPTNFHVQSYGQDVMDGRADPREFNPRDACNPSAEH